MYIIFGVNPAKTTSVIVSQKVLISVFIITRTSSIGTTNKIVTTNRHNLNPLAQEN